MNLKFAVIALSGTLFIVFLGTTLHFTYAASGNNMVVGGFSAVNESVWEHLKLPFWPALAWTLVELALVRRTVGNFFLSRAVGAYFMVTIIPIVFYAYTAFLSESLAIDIGTFIAAVVVGQIITYRLFNRTKPSKRTETIALTALILLAVVFIAFTYYPPHVQLFLDPETSTYGIFHSP